MKLIKVEPAGGIAPAGAKVHTFQDGDTELTVYEHNGRCKVSTWYAGTIVSQTMLNVRLNVNKGRYIVLHGKRLYIEKWRG